MNLIGLMCVRNEEWVLGLSLRAALDWCDSVVVLDHNSSDQTMPIIIDHVNRFPGRVSTILWPTDEWAEMNQRQATLEVGRQLGGTHFAIIDADEVLTHNFLPNVRRWCEMLEPGQVLDVPMIPTWRSMGAYRSDPCVWSRASLSLAFCDRPDLRWAVRDQGYQHHARAPQGSERHRFKPVSQGDGGVFHLQFANWERLKWKHRFYKMREVTRWPDRRTVAEVDRIYSQALNEDGLEVTSVPTEWWGDYDASAVCPPNPWFKEACEEMLHSHDIGAFEGLNLWGWPE